MRENIIFLESVGSTNDFLRERAVEGAPDGTVVVAFEQLAGKGRQGHSFVSNPGGVYLSLLIRPGEGDPLPDLMTVTAKVGVCVCSALKEAFQLDAGIKWVNDVYYHEKKICGILVEGAPFVDGRIPYMIVGLGTNLNQESFPSELSGIATSLKIEHHRDFSKTDFVESLISNLYHLRKNLASPDYLQEYRRLCLTVGREVTYTKNGILHHSLAVGIDDSFGLITEEETLRSGEVSVRF